MNSVPELVAALLAQRKRRGITKKQIAQACNVAAPVVSHVERGEVDPTVTFLLVYADAVGADLSWNLSSRNQAGPERPANHRPGADDGTETA